MKVRMTATYAGPLGVYAAGQSYCVSELIGRGMVEIGIATSPDYDKTAKPAGKPAAVKGKGGGDAGDA